MPRDETGWAMMATIESIFTSRIEIVLGALLVAFWFIPETTTRSTDESAVWEDDAENPVGSLSPKQHSPGASDHT